MNIKDIERVSQIIETKNHFLIITHVFPDGDSLGSQTALHNLLKALGKKSHMFCADQLPYQYRYLPGIDQIRQDFNSFKGIAKPVAFCLDCADQNRMGVHFHSLAEDSEILINIDHHIHNSNYGDINLVDSGKAATAQIIYDIINHSFADCLNKQIGTSIYTGILTDTGRFQYENTTSEVHRIISRLLEFGIVPSEVYAHIYENDPLNRFKLLEWVFKRIHYVQSKNFIYSYVLQEDFEKLDLPFSAQDGIIEILRSTKGVKIAALIKQIAPQKCKVSLRTSDKRVNVAQLAMHFGGGGHRMAAAYSCTGSIKKIADALINLIGKQNNE